MFAVFSSGGKQHRVTEGEVVRVEKLAVEAGDEVVFDKVLLVSDENGVTAGAPVVTGASVEATVLGEVKDRKVLVFKKKRRKMYRRKQGHRQRYTDLRVDKIAV